MGTNRLIGRVPFVVLTVNGQESLIRRYYKQGPFILHRSIGHRGWTITHGLTHEAVIQRLPTLAAAEYVAAEFVRLSGKWLLCENGMPSGQNTGA